MLRTLIALCVASAFAYTFREDLDAHWSLYKIAHNKSYATEIEEADRREIWEFHVDYIARHNREYDMGLHTYTVGLNKYADMSNEEFVEVMNGYRGNKIAGQSIFSTVGIQDVPDAVDWRKQGLVTPVKDQGQCGSCWAFSTTGSLEGQHCKATGTLPNLSEQNLVDCSRAFGNNGCEGGLMDNAFNYIKSNGGIDTEVSYPYTARDGKCKYTPSGRGAGDTGFVDIPSGDEDALKTAVANIGPVSVAIDAGHSSFQLYKSGVYNEKACSSVRLDHGVLAVGYDSAAGQDYWIVKNSWGTSWGQQGYIWMSRNKHNQCGIATKASYPLV